MHTDTRGGSSPNLAVSTAGRASSSANEINPVDAPAGGERSTSGGVESRHAPDDPTDRLIETPSVKMPAQCGMERDGVSQIGGKESRRRVSRDPGTTYAAGVAPGPLTPSDPFAPEALHPPRQAGAGVVIALDLGTKTGWATLQCGVVASGVQSFQPRRFDGGGMRYLRFRRWLDELRGESEIAQVAFEEVRRHMGVDAAHCYGGMMATLTAWCEQHGIPYEGVPVGSIKRHATGKGNADKHQMIAWAKSLGHMPASDDEADALALLDFVTWGRGQ